MSFNGELWSDGVSRYFLGTVVRRSAVLAGFFSRPLTSCCAGVSWTMPCFHSLHLAGLLQRGVVLVVGCREVRSFFLTSAVRFTPLVAVRHQPRRLLSYCLHLPIPHIAGLGSRIGRRPDEAVRARQRGGEALRAHARPAKPFAPLRPPPIASARARTDRAPNDG